MATTPFGLTFYDIDGQDQGPALLNEWLALLDWKLRGSPVEDIGLNDADAVTGLADGKAWFVASAPTAGDAWEGQNQKIAFYYGGWLFFTPSHGMLISVLDEKIVKVWNSAAAWEDYDGTAWT
jgi:hypothetical protein